MTRRWGAAVIAFVAVSCARPEVTLLPSSELPDDVYGSPRATPSPPALPKRGTVFMVRRESRLVPVQRPLQGVAGSLPEALLLALLQAPSENERIQSFIPPDTRVNALEVEGLVATVDLSEEFEQGAPPRSQALRLAQVVYTLTEDPSPVRAVRFAINGDRRAVIGGPGLAVLDRPVSRADYAQFVEPPE